MRKDNYFIKTLNGLTYGFFCSLIIRTILKQLGSFTNISELTSWGQIAMYLMGPAIGAGIGYAIDAKGLNLITAIIAGSIGAGTFNGNVTTTGNPIAAYIAVIGAVEVTRFVQGKTPIDILLVPFTSIVVSGMITVVIGPYLTKLVIWIGDMINQGVNMQPILMSIVVAVLMGMALTAPVSSAAIGVMLGLNGLAAGAALAGCCAQMIGFAVMSIDDNDIGDVIAIAIGTSMLQFKNIVQKPIIWIPPIISGIVIAPISTCILNIACSPVGSGMGTAGMVGILEAINVMGSNYWIPLIVIDIIAPAFISFVIYKMFKKLLFIKSGDLKLSQF